MVNDIELLHKLTTKKGKEIVVRSPKQEDVQELCRYENAISQERTFVRLQGEEISLEEENKLLHSVLMKIDQKTAISLLVLHEDKIVGKGQIEMFDKIAQHTGVLGLSVAENFRHEGIGTFLLQALIDRGVREISSLEIVRLGVFLTNKVAIEMYKKLGFREYGVLPRGIKISEGHYDDCLFMYKTVRDPS